MIYIGKSEMQQHIENISKIKTVYGNKQFGDKKIKLRLKLGKKMLYIETDMNQCRVSYSKQYDFFSSTPSLHEICVSETWHNNNTNSIASN